MTLLHDLQEAARRSSRFFVGLGLVLLGLYLASGLYSVNPDQRGVVKRFGHVVNDNVKPGMHYRLPWPIEQVSMPAATEIKTLNVSFGFSGTAPDPGRPATHPPDHTLVTGDRNLLALSLGLQYLIAEPGLFGAAVADPANLLKGIVEHQAILQLAAMDVDETLTTGRQRIQRQLQTRLQSELDRLDMGISLSRVQLQAVEPPRKVAAGFSEVNAAREDKRRLVREAEGDRDRRLIKTRVESNALVQEAEARATEVVSIAEGDAERFLSIWREYRSAKAITAHRLYLETLEAVLPRVRLLIANPDAEQGSAITDPLDIVPHRLQAEALLQ